ncbi:MAG: Rieske Fe-S protein [Planctomycetota bacterium]|nr:Rieske Fe-S protein [Planctomycetota bacterium]
MTRRDFYTYGTMVLGGLMSAALAVPGVAYLLDPLGKRRGSARVYPLAKLSELEVGIPRSFQIVDERQDAWVNYPKEPIGTVWLVRQAPGSADPVIAFQAECPHLGCAVNLAPEKNAFRCPCHNSSFTLSGTPGNKIPPRGMDRLDVEATGPPQDPTIRVKFERFRSQSERKIPLA